MDKNKSKKLLANLKTNISGYSIEIGDTTYNDTLEERIQAAKAASSAAKQAQKPKGKLFIPKRNIVVEKDAHLENITVKKSNNSVQALELKKRNRQRWTSFKSDFMPASNNCSTNSSISKNINSNLHFNNNSTLFKSTCKEGGSMQRRLEAIKASKKLSNLVSNEHNLSSTVESFKFSNNPSRNDSTQALTNNHTFSQYDPTCSKLNEYKTRSTVQKYCCEIDHRLNTLNGHYPKNITSSSNCSKNTVSSVQNRLVKVKEEMKAKSKLFQQNDASKTEMAKNLPASGYNKIQNTLTLKNNPKTKTKRLTTTNESTKKKIPITTIKKIKSSNPNVNKIIHNKELITIQPITPNCTLSNITVPETIVSSKVENVDVVKKSQQKELDSFSFIIPKTFSVQQRLENKKKNPDSGLNIQLNNDDSMEWEGDVELNNIVNTVNDLRKITHEYEPMEWIPDSVIPDTVMYCDEINNCLVVDTNILLLDLKSITIALDKFFPDYGYLTFVLPWQVFQELDYIKKQENQLGFRAREATRWMLEKFSARHPRLKGQPMTIKENESNDDAILKCAIHIRERVNHVNLITDDQILSIKAEVNGITAKNSTWLKDLVSASNHSESNIFQDAVNKYPVIRSNLIKDFEPHLEHILAKVLKFAIYNNKSYSIFSKKMWWKVYSLTPPFSLIKCLLKIKQYWNIIAPQTLLNGPQKQLEWLICFLMELQPAPPEINLSWNEFYDFLKYCFEIINALPFEYYHITDALLNNLMIVPTGN